MEMIKYKTVYEGGQGEIEEKKSRFIATIRPVETEAEATSFIQEMKKKYWDARHNCSAYVVGADYVVGSVYNTDTDHVVGSIYNTGADHIIGKNQEITRCSDDGEPSGTAGRPMLDVLQKEGIHNVAVVVTRYFGGTLLGTGGLVRAYQKSVQAGLAACVIIEKQSGEILKINTDYNGMGKIQYMLGNEQIEVMDIQYADAVEMTAVIPAGRQAQIAEKITDITNGQAELRWEEKVEFAIIQKKILIFS